MRDGVEKGRREIERAGGGGGSGGGVGLLRECGDGRRRGRCGGEEEGGVDECRIGVGDGGDDEAEEEEEMEEEWEH